MVRVQAFLGQDTERLVQGLQVVFREASPLEPDLIHPERPGSPLGHDHGVWQHVLRDDAVAPYVAMRSDPAKLMHAAMGAHHRVILDSDVPAQGRRMRQDASRANQAVMGHVRVRLQ